MDKDSFRKLVDGLYKPSQKKVEVLDIPDMKFLMIDGQGSPASKEFEDSVQALYSISYALKMMPKKGNIPDGYSEYSVPPLEGLWYSKNKAEINLNNKEDWSWALMIMQPNFVTAELFSTVKSETIKKKGFEALNKVRFENFKEGLCAQIMHIGPYAEETPTVEKIQQFTKDNGYLINGRHHEIYLGDPRRTQPEKLKTIIRYPISKS